MAQQPNIDNLRAVLHHTLSADPNVRKAAEKELTNAKATPGHPLQVLQIVASAEAVNSPVRQAAAVHFKNIVKKGWVVDEDNETTVTIPLTDRNLIKTHLVELMCTVPPQIQAQCSEAISIIASSDFPSQWDNLLPDLVGKFSSPDPAVVQGVLLTASSIMKRFRYVQKSDALFADIIYVLQRLQEPLLTLFKTMGKEVDALSNDAAQLVPRFESLRLMCRIFYSLNWQDLPEYFEDHMAEWMEEFAKYLQYTNPILIDDDEETEPSPIDKLQCAIIENLTLYANKDEEPFIPFLPKFTSLVWNLLLNVSALPKQDRLAGNGIKFLAGLVGKMMHAHLFKDEETLKQIISRIVVPNLVIREVDEEKFEDDPQEFILSDMEASESDSRRKCSQDLLRAMCRQFEDQTTSICMVHIQSMVAEFNADPASKWTAKDVAIHLMLGISIKAESTLGVSAINPQVDLVDFFTKNIVPELQDANHNVRPMVKATAIKFVTTFRNQFSKDNWNTLLPLLISHLSSNMIVVHSYAANGIEKLLLIKQDGGDGVKRVLFGRKDIQPLLETLFVPLFTIIDNEKLNENSYIMKCTMRCLSVAKADIVPVTHTVLDKLTAALARVAKNPRDPQFNHYLFESIAVLIRSVCSNDATHTTAFETLLFPPFQTILQMDVSEFTPYVFQLFAQILEYRPVSSGLGPAYVLILPALLTPTLWERKSNIPALTRLLGAYITKSPNEVIAGNCLLGILGIFQKLISSRANEQSGFELLESITLHFPLDVWKPHLPSILQILLVRLQQGKSPRFTRLATRFFALLIGKYGPTLYLDEVNSIQPRLGFTLLANVWLPRLQKDAPVRMEAKIQVVGLTKILCDTPALLADADGQRIWSQCLHAAMKIVTSPEYQQGIQQHQNDDDDDFDIEIGYDASYTKLHFAGKPSVDCFLHVQDAGLNLVKALAALCASRPGSFSVLIQQALASDGKLSASLNTMMTSAGVNFA